MKVIEAELANYPEFREAVEAYVEWANKYKVMVDSCDCCMSPWFVRNTGNDVIVSEVVSGNPD